MSYEKFTVETDADGIALVTWDMPDRSMNVFTEEVMNELDAIIDQIAGSDEIKGAVITSGWIRAARSTGASSAISPVLERPPGTRTLTLTPVPSSSWAQAQLAASRAALEGP